MRIGVQNIISALTVMLVLMSCCRGVAGQPTQSLASGISIPQKVTPNHVYAGLELLNRKLDQLLNSAGRTAPAANAVRSRESGLKPMHVYQIHLACIEQLRGYQFKAGLPTMPLAVATPEKYSPAQVFLLTKMLLEAVDRDAIALGAGDLPGEMTTFQGKTPTDVFQIGVTALMKILALSGTNDISPNEVFSQTVRARYDAQAIVTTAAQYEVGDADIRRRLKAKSFGMSSDGRHLEVDTSVKRKPSNAFEECLRVRETINALRQQLNAPTTPMPSYEVGEKIRPADVYLQTQLIIAELNLLKMLTGTTVTTPPAQPVTGKSPNEVFAEAAWARFALNGLLNHLESHPEAAVLRRVASN